MPDWLGWALGGALIVAMGILYVRSRQTADIGPRSTTEELEADVERDLELERLGTRPRA